MSQLYGAAVQEGVSSLELMFTGSNAKTRAAYDAAYANEASRIQLRARQRAAQRNLAAVQQDKILTNKAIQVQNTQAQAMAKLSAAVAGVTGNSVDDVSQQIDVRTIGQISQNEKQAKQMSDQFLAQVQGSYAQLLGVQDKKINVLADTIGAVVGNLTLDDTRGMASNLGLWGG